MRRIGFLIIIIFIVSGFSCKKVPFFATEGATITISSDKTYLKTGGELAIITIIGFNADGEALHDHTLVILSASLGEITPSEIELMEGRAVVEFKSGSRSGVAEIKARSGNVTAEPDPLQITIGSAALETLSISANPSNFESGGGRSKISVYAFDKDGNLLSDIPIILSTTAGSFESGKVIHITDSDGKIEDFLYTTETATVKAESGEKSAELEITVEELAENVLPTANFTYSPQSPVRGETIYFNASSSSDSDGRIVNYRWDFGDSNVGYGVTVNHSYDWIGDENKTFVVVLKVTDNRGGTNTHNTSINVSWEAGNELPTANFTYDPSSPTISDTIQFDGSSSSDPDGYIILFEWDFGDGSTVEYGVNVNHQYTATGTYRVNLTVTDNSNGKASLEREVTVN